jgi:hypothetical protein
MIVVCALLIVAVVQIREAARRAECGRKAGSLVRAQREYGASRQDLVGACLLLRGTERFCYFPSDPPTSLDRRGSDGSRFYIAIWKSGYFYEGDLVCPSDPFAVPFRIDKLDAAPPDTPPENRALPFFSAWRYPSFPREYGLGNTFFSYSMQAGNSAPEGDIGLGLSPKIPLFGERNPWCSVLREILPDKLPTDESPSGNPWSHNRAGATVAFIDGRVEFLTDAAAVEAPIDPNGRNLGFDYLYNDARPLPGPPRPPVGGACVPPGSAAWSGTLNVWLAD